MVDPSNFPDYGGRWLAVDNTITVDEEGMART